MVKEMSNKKENNMTLKLAKKMYKKKLKSNILLIVSMILTIFMLTTVFSIGLGYWNITTKRSLAMSGMKYDITLTEPTKKQEKIVKNIKEIKYAGVTVKTGIIKSINDNVSREVRLYWSDKINWEKQRLPAFEFMKGKYPQEKNEIVFSTAELKEMGIKKPKIGMKIKVKYSELSEKEEKNTLEMVLSGYYRDYNTKGDTNAFISKKLYDETSVKQTDFSQGELKISLKNPIYSNELMKEIENKVETTGFQSLQYDPHMLQNFLKMALGISMLIIFILLSSYLTIHNIIYISLSKDIRFFGQLKTIGMTSKEVKKLLYIQQFWNLLISIPVGVTLGGVVSLIYVPSVLKNMEVGKETVTDFNPIIFVFAILFTVLTTYISSRKPINIVSKISPIEAIKFSVNKNVINRNSNKKRLSLLGIAWRNIFRERKQALVIVLSFFIVMTSFLSISIIIERNSAKTVLNAIIQDDIKVLNQTFNQEYKQKPEEVISGNDLEKIKNIENISKVKKIYSTKIVVPYNESVLEEYFKKIFESPVMGNYQDHLKKYKEDPKDDMYLGKLTAIDEYNFNELNEEEFDNKLNSKDFLEGNTVIIRDAIGESKLKQPINKKIKFELLNGKEYSSKIVGINKNFGLGYISSGLGPEIIVSQNYYKSIIEDPIIETLNIDYKKPFDKGTDKEVRNVFSKNRDVTFESKMDSFTEMKNAENQMKVLGVSLIIILIILVILNYCNMTITSIQNRKKEFAVLKSIGMTYKQAKKIVALEGFIYGLLSYVLVLILGIPFSYYIYKSINKFEIIPYSIPIMINIIVFALMFIVFLIIPIIIYKILDKDTNIIEQIKSTE